jgi:hypothetical protein
MILTRRYQLLVCSHRIGCNWDIAELGYEKLERKGGRGEKFNESTTLSVNKFWVIARIMVMVQCRGLAGMIK